MKDKKRYGKLKAIIKPEFHNSEVWIEDNDGNRIYIPVIDIKVFHSCDELARATIDTYCDHADITLFTNKINKDQE